MSDKARAMLSQPMAGKTDGEIAATRERATGDLEARGYEVVNTLFTDEWYSPEAMEARGVVQVPLCYLAKSLESMCLCRAAYFCEGWEDARGCRIEHAAAVAYGLDVLYAPGAFTGEPEEKQACADGRHGFAYVAAVTGSQDERGRWLSAWPAIEAVQERGAYPSGILCIDPAEMRLGVGRLLEAVGCDAGAATVYMSFDDGLLRHAEAAKDALQALGVGVEMCGDWTGGPDGE